VLLVLSLVELLYLDGADFSDRLESVAAGAPLTGVVPRSGDFFLLPRIGREREPSAGTEIIPALRNIAVASSQQ
jgi:hypothetical protein